MSGESEQALAVDIPHVVGDFFDAGDLEALTHLDRAHEFGGFEQGFVSAGIKPSIAAPQALDPQEPTFEIDIVEVSDFELAARRGSETGSNLAHRLIVKI